MLLRVSSAFIGPLAVAALFKVVMVVVAPIRVGDQSSLHVMVPPLGSIAVSPSFRMRLENINMYGRKMVYDVAPDWFRRLNYCALIYGHTVLVCHLVRMFNGSSALIMLVLIARGDCG